MTDGRYHRAAFHPVPKHLDQSLVRWALRQHKRLRRGLRKAWAWLGGVKQRDRGLFVHWNELPGKHAAG